MSQNIVINHMIQYKKTKNGLYFKSAPSSYFRPVYSKGKQFKPSPSFKKLFKTRPDFNVHPDFIFAYNPSTNRFWKKTNNYKNKIKNSYREINNRLIEKSVDIGDWKKNVQTFVHGRFKNAEKRRSRKSKALRIKAHSSLLHNVTQDLTFRDYYHFENWHDKVMDKEVLPNYGYNPKYKDVAGQYGYDCMKHAVLNLSWCRGGCFRCESERIIEGAYFQFEVIDPQSRRNNCGLACLKCIDSVNLPSELKVRKAFNLKPGSKIDPHTLGCIYEKYNTDASILSIITKDESFTPNPLYNYILLKNDHYHYVKNTIAKNVNRAKYKRSLLAFDFETRKIGANSYTYVGDTKSYYIKDAICQVVYRDLKSRCMHKLSFRSTPTSSSARQFLDWLLSEHARGKHYTCLAHNGARFDFYLLHEQFTKNEMLHTEMKLRGTSVIQMEFSGHIFKDPCCFMPNSLENLCHAFKVPTPKLQQFTYKGKTLSSMELCFYKPELSCDEFMELQHNEPEYWKLYEEYCYVDCVSLFQLWEMFCKNTEVLIGSISPFLLKTCGVNTCCTIGGLAKRILTNLHKQDKFGIRHKYESFLFMEEHEKIKKKDGHNIVDLKIDPEKYAFVTKFKIGGISHCHQPGKHEQSVASIDITSQYSAAMKYMKVPAGNSKWTNKYERKKHGFYLINNMKFGSRTKHANASLKPICTTDDKGRRIWSNKSYGQLYVDSEMIKYLIDHYDLQTFEVEKGLVSNTYIRGNSLFGKYVDILFAAKAEQDEFKKNNSPEYNPALRAVIKLFLNALTGKLVEDPTRYFSLNYVNKQNFLAKDGNNIRGLAVEKQHQTTYNTWLHAGCMVYSYSKRNLFEYIHCLPKNDDIIHIETDGLYFHAKHCKYLEKQLKNYANDDFMIQKKETCTNIISIGDNLGNVKYEHKSKGPSYWLGKKCYYLNCEQDGHVMKCKGIPDTTITEAGSKQIILKPELYERVYNGESVSIEYSCIVKKVFAEDTRMSTHIASRTINPSMKYKLYKG